jgi:hypothetical protein
VLEAIWKPACRVPIGLTLTVRWHQNSLMWRAGRLAVKDF